MNNPSSTVKSGQRESALTTICLASTFLPTVSFPESRHTMMPSVGSQCDDVSRHTAVQGEAKQFTSGGSDLLVLVSGKVALLLVPSLTIRC